MPALIDRTGEVNYNKFGTKMTIIEYLGDSRVTVQFDDDHKFLKTIRYDCFKMGAVKNPYDKTIYGIGYFGPGMSLSSINKIITPEYNCWRHMFYRCYDYTFHKKYPSYIGCSVHHEWHNFQNFAEWYNDNFYELYLEKVDLDKDILVKGNKVYGPKTCCFVPSRINKLTENCKSLRGKYPVGVRISKNGEKFEATLQRKHIGSFDSVEKAFCAYKECKERSIKKVADEYEHIIPLKVYKALLNYKVEISD